MVAIKIMGRRTRVSPYFILLPKRLSDTVSIYLGNDDFVFCMSECVCQFLIFRGEVLHRVDHVYSGKQAVHVKKS
jgi:hypothetical protein